MKDSVNSSDPGHLGEAGDGSVAPRSGVTPWENPKALRSWVGVHDLLCENVFIYWL